MIDSLDGMQTLNLVVLPKLGDCFPLSEIQLPYLRWPPLLKKKKRVEYTGGVCVLSRSVLSNSCDSTHYSLPQFVLCPWGFPKREYWHRLPFSLPGEIPDPGIEPASPVPPAFFTTEPPGKPI